MGLRSTDKWGVPLCAEDHDLVERAGTRNETLWFSSRGVTAHELAQALWASRGNLPVMVRIVASHAVKPQE